MKTTRGDRYAREIRSNETSRNDEEEITARKRKREAYSFMNEQISKTLMDLLRHTNPESADKICKRLEKDVYRKYPTPVNRLRMAVDYIQASGVDVTARIWAIQIGCLKERVNVATDPNNFYKFGEV